MNLIQKNLKIQDNNCPICKSPSPKYKPPMYNATKNCLQACINPGLTFSFTLS